MTPLELLKLVGTIASVALVLGGGWFWAIKWALSVQTKHLDKQLKTISDAQGASIKRMEHFESKTERRIDSLEKDMLRLRADMAEKYVGREDWIRFGVTLQSKVDAVGERVELIRLEMADAAGRSRSEAAQEAD